MRLSFRGKSGVRHEVEVRDPRVLKVVKRCMHLPGQELFQYKDDAGEVRSVTSGDVNDFLQTACGERFTAKDFRTWHGSVLALETLKLLSASGHRFALKDLLGNVSALLGNTPAVCRKAYIHPEVLALCLELAGTPDQLPEFASAPVRGLSAAEQRLVGFLERNRPRRRRAAKLHGLPTA
jgi:DNA topoisomerase-1